MSEIVPWLAAIGAFAAVLGCLAWLAARLRRRGVGREIMGPIDLIYRPYAQHLNIELQAQEQRMAPMPSPGDPLRPGPGGTGQPRPTRPTPSG
jgi:hypothetical protein